MANRYTYNAELILTHDHLYTPTLCIVCVMSIKVNRPTSLKLNHSKIRVMKPRAIRFPLTEVDRQHPQDPISQIWVAHTARLAPVGL